MKPKAPKFLINTIFFLHFIIITLRFGLFFVSSKFRPGKINFYFRFTIILVAGQFLWALIIFRKWSMICPFTTLMQHMRGHSIYERENYDHSFIAELLQKLKINIDAQIANLIQKNILFVLTGAIILIKYLSIGNTISNSYNFVR